MPQDRLNIARHKDCIHGICILLFIGAAISSLFLTTDKVVDGLLLPKRFAVILCICGILLLLSVKSFFSHFVSNDCGTGLKRWGASSPRREFVFYALVTCVTANMLYSLGKAFVSGEANVTGSFDNSAGIVSSVCITAPYCFLLLKKKKKSSYAVPIAILVLSAIFLFLLYTKSRAGIITLTIIFFFLLSHFFKAKAQAITFSIVLFLILLLGLYYVNKDSSDGRFLISLCSIEMIKDKPCFGFGLNGFTSHYMDYQAHYFAAHPQSRFAMLAGNIRHPMNEYLLLLVNFGIIGFSVLLLSAFFFLRAVIKRNLNVLCWGALLSLLSLAIFSLFSYPFCYPYTWLIALLNLWTLITETHLGQRTTTCILSFGFIKLVTIILSICCIVFITYKTSLELKWKELVDKVNYGIIDNDIIDGYKLLEKEMGNNPAFLYNYAAVLFSYGDNDAALNVALKCRLYWSDYDLELMLGLINMQIFHADKDEVSFHNALSYFEHASKMIPCRFIPLHYQLQLYQETLSLNDMYRISNEIITKPVKVPSSKVEEIKSLAKNIVNNIENYNVGK